MGLSRILRRAGLAGAVALLLAPHAAPAADRLPAFAADPSQTTMSGLSSGAFMTAQFQVAYSADLMGAAVVAGGPWDCAEGKASFALNRCMNTALGAPDPAHLLDLALQAEKAGKIDPLAALAQQRVYVFGGSVDPVVTPPVVASLVDFYKKAGVPEANLLAKTDVAAGHAFITGDFGNACGKTASPFINNCAYDQAGALLAHLYGPLAPPAATPAGRILAFDQGEFLAQPRRHGLDDAGYLYVPPACDQPGVTCRLHVAVHGCLQGRESIGETYVTRTGFNRWADTNRLLVLYPQAVKTPANPDGCWDWFAYDDPAYATRNGRQMRAIKAMIDRVLAARQ